MGSRRAFYISFLPSINFIVSITRRIEECGDSYLSLLPNTSIHNHPHTQLVLHANLVESVVLVLEAGYEEGVNLQGVVVGSKLERQGRVTLFLKTPVGIQYLDRWMETYE